jgi:hypothetical protein
MLYEVGTNRNRSSRRWNKWDSINIAVLALVNLALRGPFFHVPILMIDEAEYMAEGAFAQATQQSAFTFPALTYTIEAFKMSAACFGRYNATPARVAVAIMACAVAAFIYRWLARDTSRALAIASAALFSVWNLVFDGAFIDREWPCMLAILAGAQLFIRAQRRADNRGPWLVFAAGLTTSLALFFKEQAAYMTLAAPLWLVFKAAETRRWRPWLGQGVLYLGGGLTGGAIYITPFLIQGTLLAHVQSEMKFGSVYTSDTPPVTASLFKSHQNLLTKPRGVCLFFMLAGAWCLVQGARALWRLRRGARRDGGVRRDRELLAVLYVGTATAAVRMGSQVFLHYFLFWIPFALVVEGYAIYALTRLCAHRRGGVAVAAIIGFGALAVIPFLPPDAVGWPAAGAAAVLVLAGWACFPRPIPPSRLVAAVSIAMALLAATEAGTLVKSVAAIAAEVAATTPSVEAREFFVRQSLPPTDRLFVWGWRPEFYCASGLEPASHYIVCNGVLNAFWTSTAIDEAAADRLLAKLLPNPPRFIVAGPPTERSFSTTLYPLRAFPALQQWVRREYRLVAELPDCEIYERQANPSGAER